MERIRVERHARDVFFYRSFRIGGMGDRAIRKEGIKVRKRGRVCAARFERGNFCRSILYYRSLYIQAYRNGSRGGEQRTRGRRGGVQRARDKDGSRERASGVVYRAGKAGRRHTAIRHSTRPALTDRSLRRSLGLGSVKFFFPPSLAAARACEKIFIYLPSSFSFFVFYNRFFILLD